MADIVMYGADWCGDCHRARRFLDRRGIAYRWIDVEHDPAMAEEARRIGGRSNIPVMVFPDGSVLVEPSDAELEAKVGVASAG
ncbi:MAG TPA: glutaredoxin domain-containing protein [Actinomycetota bacterium]|nr:glutaredoxin domain-containing protein [Actinomycetota bacterium]